EYADARGIHADFLVRLAEGRLRERLARIRRATRQADLSRVALQSARADRERNRRAGRARVDEQQTRRDPRVRRKLTGLPAGPRRRRHEAALRVESGQRAAQPLAQRSFERGERYHWRVFFFFVCVVLFFVGADLSDRSASRPTLSPYAFTQLYSRT